MGIARISLGTKSMDSILAFVMFAGVALTAAAVIFLLGRHHHHGRKARKHADHKKRDKRS
jgi:hypothetical protein